MSRRDPARFERRFGARLDGRPDVGLNVGLLASLLGACSVPTLHAPSAPSPPAQAPAAPAQTAPPAPPSAPAAPAVPARRPARLRRRKGQRRQAAPGPRSPVRACRHPGPRGRRQPAARRARRPGPRSDTLCSVPRWPAGAGTSSACRRHAVSSRRTPTAPTPVPCPSPCWPFRCLRWSSMPTAACAACTCLRHPRQARDTTQMAIDAVHRAAPYGSMARDCRVPWKWAEVFLFDDDRRFKPRDAGSSSAGGAAPRIGHNVPCSSRSRRC
jgi:hypothetical protein